MTWKLPSGAAVLLIAAAGPAGAQMAHPAGMSHQQVVAAASAGAPAAVSANATIAWIDSAGHATVMRQGTNAFTCFIVVPDMFDGPICADQNGMQWFNALFSKQAAPPTLSAPGIVYMARGGSHYEDAEGHMAPVPTAGFHKVMEGPHWMMMWPFDPATTGLPTMASAAGSYVMFAGSPWAHMMVMQDPATMASGMRH